MAREIAIESLWIRASETPAFSSKPIFPAYDIVIVGAGIVGVTVAHRLRDAGKRILVIEAADVLKGTTGHTTGKLTAQHGLLYQKIAAIANLETAAVYFEAQRWAVDEVRNSGIDCDLIDCPAHVYAETDEGVRALEKEASLYREMGIAVELGAAPESSISMQKRLTLAGQACFNPRRYLLRLLKEAKEAGVEIVANNRVLKVTETASHCIVETESGTLTAEYLVSASHYPVHDSALFITKLTSERSYAMAFEVADFPDGCSISAPSETFRSWRPVKVGGKPGVIVGSGHHRTGDVPEISPYEELEEWARAHFLPTGAISRWSAQDLWTPDHLPYIGQSPGRNRISLACGFGGWGMSNGIVAGRILADHLLGVTNPWAKIFNPSRMMVRAVPSMVRENFQTMSHLVVDKVKTPGDIEYSRIRPGSGAVGLVKGQRRAVYKKPNGQILHFKSQCTHMGCELAWNPHDKSWDCPCHGSRFSPEGAVLNGPAVTGLKVEPE